MTGGKSKSRTKKFDRKRSALRPRIPEKKLKPPLPPLHIFIEQEFLKKYRETHPVRGPNYFTNLMEVSKEEWDSMGKEKRAPYEEIAAKQVIVYNKYLDEEYSLALTDYNKRVAVYIKSREEAAAAEGKSYSYWTDEEDTDSESEESAGEEESHSGSETKEAAAAGKEESHSRL